MKNLWNKLTGKYTPSDLDEYYEYYEYCGCVLFISPEKIFEETGKEISEAVLMALQAQIAEKHIPKVYYDQLLRGIYRRKLSIADQKYIENEIWPLFFKAMEKPFIYFSKRINSFLYYPEDIDVCELKKLQLEIMNKIYMCV